MEQSSLSPPFGAGLKRPGAGGKIGSLVAGRIVSLRRETTKKTAGTV
jgi:hypothetical protein